MYDGVEFFDSNLVKNDEVCSEGKKEQVKDESNEGENAYFDATDSESESIEKSTGRDEEKYKEIITRLEKKLEPENKDKKAKDENGNLKLESSPSKSRSRFGWIWGGDVPENQGDQLEIKIRKRSKTLDGGSDDDDIPSPRELRRQIGAKSERGVNYPRISKFQNVKNEGDLESQESEEKVVDTGEESPPPKRKGLFRRFMGFFSGKRDDKDQNNSQMFSLEKVPPKQGDNGPASPKESKNYNKEVGMSLCKNRLFTCDKEEVDDVFNENEISYEDF